MRLPRTFQVLAMTEWEKDFIVYIGIWVQQFDLLYPLNAIPLCFEGVSFEYF
jgi:hypothetical protein